MTTAQITLSADNYVERAGALGTRVMVRLEPPLDNGGAGVIAYEWEAERRSFGYSNAEDSNQTGRILAENGFEIDFIYGLSSYGDGVNNGFFVHWEFRAKAVNEVGAAEEWSDWARFSPPLPEPYVNGNAGTLCGNNNLCVRVDIDAYGFEPNERYFPRLNPNGQCERVFANNSGEIDDTADCEFFVGENIPPTFTIRVDDVWSPTITY